MPARAFSSPIAATNQQDFEEKRSEKDDSEKTGNVSAGLSPTPEFYLPRIADFGRKTLITASLASA